MVARSWITAGWVLIAAMAALAIAAIVQALDAVGASCGQMATPGGPLQLTCQNAGPEFVRGLICAVLAGVAFFSGLACFSWAVYLRFMQQMARIRPPQAQARHRLWG